MGGKALKDLVESNQVVRVNETQLLSAFDETKSLMEKCFSNVETKMAMPKYIKLKDTFGDLDFIVGVDKYKQRDIMIFLLDELNLKEFNIKNQKDYDKTLQNLGFSEFKFEDFKSLDDKSFYKLLELTGLSSNFFPNSNILSFALPLDKQLSSDSIEQKYLQVDLIFTTLKNFEPTYNYLSNNDFSNFLGRLARTQGLKYGVTGLYTEVYYNDMNANSDIHLTSDMNVILETLDLDTTKYYDGFLTFDDMFEYLATSQYFNPMIFDLDYRNHDARQRDNKRDAYKKMLEFCNKYENKVLSTFINQNTKDVILKMFETLPNDNSKTIHQIKETLNNIENDLYRNGIKHIESILLNDYDITFKDFPNYNTDIQYVIKETLSYLEIKDYLKDRLNINSFDENDGLINTIIYFNQLKRLKEHIYEINSDKSKEFSDKFIAIQNLLFKVVVLEEYLPKSPSKSDLKLPYIEKFGKLDEYNSTLERFGNNEIVKQYFNGDIISNIYGVKNLELGNIMKAIKGNDFIRNSLKEFIIDIYNDKSIDNNIKQNIVNTKIIQLVAEYLPDINLQSFENLSENTLKTINLSEKTLDI